MAKERTERTVRIRTFNPDGLTLFKLSIGLRHNIPNEEQVSTVNLRIRKKQLFKDSNYEK